MARPSSSRISKLINWFRERESDSVRGSKLDDLAHKDPFKLRAKVPNGNKTE